MIRNHIRIVMCVVSCLILLSGCKSKEVKEVEKAIQSIGSVTLDSGEAITTAEALYNLLPDNEKQYVSNLDILIEAQDEFDNLSLKCTRELEWYRQQVIEKWEKDSDLAGTGRFIEDIYKKYPNDDVIANIYYYYTAKEEFDWYVKFSENDYLQIAEEYAAKIDPNYSGVLSEEMHEFVNAIIPADQLEEKHRIAIMQEQKYIALTNVEKKEICKFIEDQYNYYDKQHGDYAGDKYSAIIMQDASDKFGLSISQIKLIWANMYSY